MSYASPADGSEDVNDFLLRIRELGDKRDKEDEERTRKLEEEILQGRKERQARRADARSISPPKESPSNPSTPPATKQLDLDMTSRKNLIDPPIDLHPSLSRDSRRPESLANTTLDSKNAESSNLATADSSSSPTKSSHPSNPSTNAPMATFRAGTLSWQQRPSSRTSNTTRSRPVSAISDQDNKPDLTAAETTHPPDVLPTREQIAQSLQSKDPSWFRQTADRGIGSAAYRRNAEENISDTTSVLGSVRLPGMPREPAGEPDTSSAPGIGSLRSQSPSRGSSIRGSSTFSNRYSSHSSFTTAGGLGSPIALSSTQRPDPRGTDKRTNDATLNERVAMSPSQGRLSPDRPTSPTKGLGGFVQSAMLKRSDSVNKRWSTQAPVGLSRADSIASNRSSYNGYGSKRHTHQGSSSPPREMRPLSIGRESSPLSNSRPGSNHSDATVVANLKENERSGISGMESSSAASDDPLKPKVPQSQTKENKSTKENGPESPDKDESLPVSPTKTMDSKRWSPTKSSWLESAINKPPDSPKPKTPTPQPPGWMVGLNKSKLQKSTSESGQNGGFKEVTTGGLLRSPPLNGPTNPMALSGLPEGPSSGIVKKGNSLSPTRSVSVETLAKSDVIAEIPKKAVSHNATTTDHSRILSTDEDKADKIATRPNHFASTFTAQQDMPPPNTEVKPKPETPPKKDFRANLKARQPPKEGSTNQEPEFKNALGKLKRTQTKNYVAPDEFKDNILRGKAGLTVTGGPKKTDRVDEFKESILKRKEEMKSGGSTRRSPSTDIDNKYSHSSALPEALAKMKTLGRANNNSSYENSTRQGSLEPDLPRPADKQADSVHDLTSKSDNKPKPVLAPKLAPKHSPTREPLRHQTSTTEPNLTETTDRERTSNGELTVPHNQPITSKVALKEASKSSPGDISTHPISGQFKNQVGTKLAGRLNPALADILSRGPPSANDSKASDHRSRTTVTSGPLDGTGNSGSGTNLTHVTKGRARGPKRRLPKAQASEAGNELAPSVSRIDVGVSESRTTANNEPEPPNPREPIVSSSADSQSDKEPDLHSLKNSTARSLGSIDSKPGSDDSDTIDEYLPKETLLKTSLIDKSTKSSSSVSPSSLKPKPAVSVKSPLLQRVTSPSPGTKLLENNDLPAGPTLQRHAIIPTEEDKVEAPPQNPIKPLGHEENNPNQSDKDSGVGLGLRGISIDSKSKEPVGTKSPPIPKKSSAVSTKSSTDDGFVSHPVLKKPGPSDAKTAHRIRPSITAPVPMTSDAKKVMLNFFEEAPSRKEKVDFDTQSVFLSKFRSPKIKTIRRSIWEIIGDGKKQDMPPQQEYILFEESMYLIVHQYTSENGYKINEVTLWCGDGVGEAAIEDAQLFCRKIARENSAKLTVAKQGKETDIFLQALGGILITRRRRANSMYMLCCRQHLGQIVFDEVDLSPSKLCSAFPYIISAKFGKLYLWKGKGSRAEELGCARLIGMDLGLTGEFDELSEGAEPPSFFEAFPDKSSQTVPKSSQNWVEKPNHSNYTNRLFRIEHTQRQQFGASFWPRRGSPPLGIAASITEILPFCQSDLEPQNIYVLDAFFEIYVIVGDQCQSKSAEFVTAILFAQEYSILAASLRDRPFIPASTIVLGGMPKDATASFRKWQDNEQVNNLVVVEVNAAVEAVMNAE